MARSLPTVLSGTWQRNREIIANVTSLLATTGLSMLLGFAYWNIAARLFSQTSVGRASAAISAMTLISSVGTFGLNTLLVGDLPKRTEKAGMIWAAMLAAAGGSLLLAVGFVLVVPHFTTHYNDIAESPGGAGLFCAGVALTAMCVVFDAATIGLLRGGLQLARNMTFVITKILTLVGTALVLHYSFGISIFGSWVAAIPISLLAVALAVSRKSRSIWSRPDWPVLRSTARLLANHNWLNLALQIPSLITPVVVASILAPSTTAAYYIAMTINTALFILPAHMSTVLFAVAAADPKSIARKLRFALRVTLLLGVPAMAVLGLGADFILGLFGAGYAHVAGLPMQLLVLAYLPSIPTYLYISVSRATGRLARAAAVVTGFTALEVAGVVIGCFKDGLVGMALASLVVATLEAVVTTPRVVRLAAGSGRHRRGPATDAGEGRPSHAAVGRTR